MDANRYFEQMHQVMSAQKRDFSLILSSFRVPVSR